MKRNSVFILMILLLAPVLFLSQQSQSNNVNGLTADRGSYEILSSYQGRNNVLKVDGSKTDWFIASYSLAKYRRKEITIEFSADVRREGAAGNLAWHVNNDGIWPMITEKYNAAQGQWHTIKGKLFVIPNNNNPCMYLTNWENNSPNTVYYVANFNIMITEGNPLTPDLTLTPLKSAYANNFLVGSIIDYTWADQTSGKHYDLLTHHSSTVTSAITYPVSLAPSVKGGAYWWETADRAIDIIKRKGIPVHGHVLIWHENTPEWIYTGSRVDVQANLNAYIRTVLGHFKGKINSWDVVNEAMKDNPSAADVKGDWRNGVRKQDNPWYTALGADYIEMAFRAARSADPEVKLYYNDYNNVWNGSVNVNKIDVICRMINDINTRYRAEGNTRNLIEGVGLQCHFQPKVNINDVRKSLNKLKTLGIEIAISELDISAVGINDDTRGVGKDSTMSEKDELAQARVYAKLFRLFREYKEIKRVTMWGLDDGTSWLSGGTPCLFDWKLNAKKTYYAVIDPDGFLKQYGER
ncbi:MAG: endo-1,4-beta-xylanase [Treponema sp.]|nr:endo-1,4-beta-xylanase [Treponema sp.]